MALADLEEFLPATFLPFVRMQPVPDSFKAGLWLPDATINDLSFEYIKGVQNKPVMAHVMGYDSEAPIASRQAGGERVSGELPPIKRKSRMSEKEIIRYLTPRQGTSDQIDAINSVYIDAATLIESIQSRVEWLRIKALSEQTVVYNEAGVIFEFDFGLDKANVIDLVTKLDATDGATTNTNFNGTWANHEDSDPVNDLAWICNMVQDKTGQRPATFVTDRATINHAQQSEALRLLARGATGLPGILTQEEVDSVFLRYDLPAMVSYDVFVAREEANGNLVDERILTPGKGFMVPSRPVGQTLWGPTAESRSLIGTDLQGLMPGIFASTYSTDEPPAEWVKAAAIAFPTMPNAHALVQLKLR
jgi:hypothetical protein